MHYMTQYTFLFFTWARSSAIYHVFFTRRANPLGTNVRILSSFQNPIHVISSSVLVNKLKSPYPHCCFFPCRRVLSVVLSVIRERLHEGTKIFDHQLEYTFVQDSGVTGSSFLIMLGSKRWLGPMFIFKVG